MATRKLFVVRKYVLAKNAKEAIKIENKFPVDDVWVDDDWKKQHQEEATPIQGFKK